MESTASTRHGLKTSGIPVPVAIRQLRNKSPDLPMQRSCTEANEVGEGGQKRRIFHRRTYSHDANAASQKTKKNQSSGGLKPNLNTGSSSSIIRRPSSGRRKRMRPVAYYDAQSIPLGLDSLMLHRGATTERLASGASSAHNSEEVGSGKANDLVQLCPKFINEIGGEWFLEEKGIGIVRQSLPKHMRYKVFSHLSCLVYEGTVVAEHWLPYSTNLSMNEYSRFSGSSWELSNLSPYPLEFVDYGATYYRLYFADHEHQNFFGIDDNLGPVAISLRKERLEENPPFTMSSPLASPRTQYRFIVRTSELSVLRGSVPDEAVQQSRGASTKNVSVKDVIDFVAPEVQLGCLKVAKADKKVSEELMRLDEQELNNRYKIGILYCAAGQTTEEQMYNNESGSSAFEEFLDFIGERVELKGFPRYRAGLDTKSGTTGSCSVYTEFRDCEIMFHVSTLLPFQPHNRQQLQRKRHIGNDIVTIVFQDAGSEPFSAKAIRSQFQHVFIVVRAHNPNTANTEYSVAVARLSDVPYFGPALPENGKFKKNQEFKELLLTKLVNAENAGHHCEKFMQMAIRTRSAYLQELATQHITQQTVDTGAGPGLGLLRGFSRRKEKVNIATQYLSFSPAAVAWCGHLVLDYLGSRPQPVCLGGSVSISIEVVLSLSIDSLTVLDVASRQILLHIPTSCITGWTMNGSRLLMFFDGVECLSFEINDIEEDSIAALETRLNAVAPHATKAVSIELLLSSVASICVDNGLVMGHCGDANIQQGDYIVQVGGTLTCTDKNLFQSIKQAANVNDELAEVVVLHRHTHHTLPPMVYSVMRKDLSWEQIWSARPDHLAVNVEPAPFPLESPNTDVQQEDSAAAKKCAPLSRIPGPGLSSSTVAKVQQRHIKKSQNRTYSYLQAVDKDISYLSGDSEGSSDGSRNTSPYPSGAVTGSSEIVPAENAVQNISPLSQRKAVRGALDKEPTASSNIPVSASMRRSSEPASNEVIMSLQNDSSGTGNDLQHNAVSEKMTSPWRKGRVSELRAVFAKREEGTPPPLPDPVYFSATSRRLSSEESSLPSPVSRHPVYKEPGPATGDRVVKPVLVGSNRFGFVSGNIPRPAGRVTPTPLGHDTHIAKREIARSEAAELAERANAEKREVGLSVRDRTANWERRRSGTDFDTMPHAAKPTLNATPSLLSGSKEDVGSQTAAGAVELWRRKSGSETCYPQGGMPVPDSVSSTKSHEITQKDMPVAETSVEKQQTQKKTTSVAHASSSSNLPSYAHRFSSSDTSRSTTPKVSNPTDDHSSLSLNSRLLPKSALQGNISNNNNKSKGFLSSRVGNNTFTTKLPTPTPCQLKLTNLSGSNRSDVFLQQVSSAQQSLPKPKTLTHPLSSPVVHLRSQAVDQNQLESAASSWRRWKSSAELVQPKQSAMQKRATVSEAHGTAADYPSSPATSGLLSKSLKERHSSAEMFTGTHASCILAGRTSVEERGAPKLEGASETAQLDHIQQDGLAPKEKSVYPRKVSGEEEVTAHSSSTVAFEHQFNTESQLTTTSSVGNLVASPAMPPEVPQVCMDDINSDDGSLEISGEDEQNFTTDAKQEVYKLQQKVQNLKVVLDQERRGKEELEDAMLLMKRELSLLREMRHPPLIPD